MKTPFRYLLFVTLAMSVATLATPWAGAATTGNPGQIVNQLEADLAAAQANQVDVLSPAFYKEAQDELMKARRSLEKGAKISAISKSVSEGSASLKRAEEIAQVSRTILRETIAARDKALDVQADKLGEPYRKVEEDFLNLTRAIERDNLSYAQQYAGKVSDGFRQLEIMAIKAGAIGNARQLMAEADKTRVQKSAPSAYSDAQKALNDADAFIAQNPYAADAIREKAEHAEFMARRMMAINESSNQFKGMTPEAAALYVEGLLSRLSQSMNAGDLRNQGLDAQVGSLTGAVDSLERQAQALEADKQRYQARIADLENEFGGLKGYSQEQEAARQKLAAEREFNEQFDTVQRFFGPREAEVYKQGNQLVIRLRGIQFPVGQAILTPDNYTLLSKVQQAILTFGEPTVIIEGHTDSTGSAQTNLELSQQRAEAVKAYLVANKTLPASRIRAAGYGPDRPLAPNTTAEGRAINRRIDVLITPRPAS